MEVIYDYVLLPLDQDGLPQYETAKFCTDIHGSQRIRPIEVGDQLTSPVAPLVEMFLFFSATWPAGRSIYFFSEIASHVLAGLPQF